MKNYYQIKSRGNASLVCPFCKTSELVTYDAFYENHKSHLNGFQNERKQLIMQRRWIQTLPEPPAKKRKVDNNDIEDFIVVESCDASNKVVDEPSMVGYGVVESNSSMVGFGENDELHIEYDLFRSHQILTVDISEYYVKDIVLPPKLLHQLQTAISELGHCKVQFCINAEFARDGEIKTARLSNPAAPMSETFLVDGARRLNEKIAVRQELGSKWKLSRILEVSFKITKVSDISRLTGSSYIATPAILENSRKGIVNVRNKDNLCFIYSILAVLKADIVKHHRCRSTSYEKFMSELKYDMSDMPMKLKDIKKFEGQNPGLAINVLSYNDNTTITYVRDEDVVMKHPHLDIIRRSMVKDGKQVYLLLLEGEGENFHYVAVKSLQRLMNVRSEKIVDVRIQCKWCELCLNGFRKQLAYEKHLALCRKNQIGTTLYSMPTDKWLEFKDWSKTVTPPFVVYADFESVLPKDEVHYQKHLPIAAGMLLINNITGEREYYSFVGDECILNFLKKVEDIAINKVHQYYLTEGRKPMLPLTAVEEARFQLSYQCYLCQKEMSTKVKDHDHFTGQYLGAACQKCNLARKIKFIFPVVFHNLRGYDLHHILKYGVNQFPNWNLGCIPTSSEKFLALIVRVKKTIIRFIDSYQFLNDSLAEAVRRLSDLPITKDEFNNGLIMQTKGIFPYSFATSLQVLESTTTLPPIWEKVTDKEYKLAQDIWNQSGCRNLLEYMLVYLKLDVTLLADVFQQFREKSILENQLEPLNFFGVPGMAWASALITLKEPIELLTDNEMYNFFESGIRGGLTFVNKHYVCASDNTELLYIDVNNLYGWALSQSLPYKKFKWIIQESDLQQVLQECQQKENLNALDYGYVMEVDMEIPDEIHDKLDQFPVAAEPKFPPGSKVKKLLMTLEPKYNYVTHWRTLQMYLELGVIVTKVHRAVKFKQAPIFKKYVSENTEMRKQSTNKFDKNFYKLKNNSLYGKTVENLKKRINLRLCNTKKKMVTYASKPTFKRSIKIAEDLIATELNKELVCLDRPSYIGQVVLDLSKLRMYQLHYKELEKYRRQFNCEINIVAGDTDSFFLECKGVKLDQLLPAMIDDGLLDTSNYDKDTNPLHSTKLDSVVGLFKDESEGKLNYKEWIFLRPKCYSLKAEEKTVMKVKGIRLTDTDINHETYKSVYETNEYVKVPQTRIGTKNHQLYTFQTTKVALTNADDKRVWVGTNESLAYGHYFVREDICPQSDNADDDIDEDDVKMDEEEDCDMVL